LLYCGCVIFVLKKTKAEAKTRTKTRAEAETKIFIPLLRGVASFCFKMCRGLPRRSASVRRRVCIPPVYFYMTAMDKNYITPPGFERLQEEYKELKYKERPELVQTIEWAAANGDRSENGDYIYGKKRLREIDSRLRFLSRRIDSAEIVDPLCVDSTQVRFGATVKIRDEDDNLKEYAIVGMDEADAAQGKISWRSPLARALLGKEEGDVVIFSAPGGEQEIEVLEICSKEIR